MADLKYYCPKCGNECVIKSRTKGKSRKTAIKCDDCGNFTVKFDGNMYYVVGDECLPYIVNNPSTALFYKFENLHEDELEDFDDYKEFADTAISIVDLCAGYYGYHVVATRVLNSICNVCRDGIAKGFDLRDAMIYGLSLISATHFGEQSKEDIKEAIDIAKGIGHSTEHLRILIDCAVVTSYNDFEEDIDALIDMWLNDASSDESDEDGIPRGLAFLDGLLKVLSMFGDGHSLNKNFAKAIEESKRHMDGEMTEDLVELVSSFYYGALGLCESDEKEEELFNELYSFVEKNKDVCPSYYFNCIIAGYRNGYCDENDLDIIIETYEKTKDPDYIFFCVQALIERADDDKNCYDEVFDFILAHRLDDPEADQIYLTMLALCIEIFAADSDKYEEAMSKLKENGLSMKDLKKSLKKNMAMIKKERQFIDDGDIMKILGLQKM